MPFGIDEDLWESAKEEVVASLASIARSRKTISYSALASRIESVRFGPDDSRFHALLGNVSTDQNSLGRGMLSVVVVRKAGDMEPGPGFFALAESLGRSVRDKQKFWIEEMTRVYDAWSLQNEAAGLNEPPIVTSSASPAVEPSRYWWVNQKQTYRQEIAGGYLWSPKRKSDGGRNQFYENMREVSPGDIVLSYWSGAVRAWGTAQSYAYDHPKPEEFGDAGSSWSIVGYKVDVHFALLDVPVLPKEHWALISPLLPAKYAPLNRETGDGLQSVYLAELGANLGRTLIEILNRVRPQIVAVALGPSREDTGRERWEQAQVAALSTSTTDVTEQQAIVMSRRGQGRFRANVSRLETRCRVTHIDQSEFLVASHIKPWRHCNNRERLDENNGLLLAPHVDFLFDRGFISFEDDGETIISPVLDAVIARSFGVDPSTPPNVGRFRPEQCEYLRFHRDEILRRARRG